MKALPLTGKAFGSYAARLNQLTLDSARQWGSMNVVEMLNHLRHLVEVSLDQRTMADFSNVITRTRLVRWLIIDALPWPKGKIKAPVKMIDEDLGTLEVERDKLFAAMKLFAAAEDADSRRQVRSPFLGPIALKDWSRLHGKHLDHHLRQFGV